MNIEQFEKEKEKYYVLYEMFLEKHPSIQTDNNSFILGKENEKLWIWTIDNIEEKKLSIIKERVKEELLKDNNLSIICKENFYEYLKKQEWNLETFKMGLLICDTINPIKIETGFLDHPNYGDKLPLSVLCRESYQELTKEELSFMDSLLIVENWIRDENFYVWKKNNGKITSTARYDSIKKLNIITQVYTLKEERKKGYCQEIMYELTKKILRQNHIPILYTDYENEISNHIYKKIGYKDLGYLRNIKIKEEKR